MRQAVEQWLEVVALEDTTRERYDDLIRLYILPSFGDLAAGRLDAELLERSTPACTAGAYSPATASPAAVTSASADHQHHRKVHYILRGALDRAVRWRHLSVNKAAMAEAPAPRRTESDPPRLVVLPISSSVCRGSRRWGR